MSCGFEFAPSMELLRMSDSIRILMTASVWSFVVGIPDPALRFTLTLSLLHNFELNKVLKSGLAWC